MANYTNEQAKRLREKPIPVSETRQIINNLIDDLIEERGNNATETREDDGKESRDAGETKPRPRTRKTAETRGN